MEIMEFSMKGGGVPSSIKVFQYLSSLKTM